MFRVGFILNKRQIQFQFYRKNIYRFSNKENDKVEKDLDLKKDQVNEIKNENNYVYDKRAFDQVNDKSFIEKIKKIEQNKQNTNQWALDGLKFPLLLIGTSLFIYHCWDTIPYGVVYRHASISEYIPKEKYFHAIFTGALSFQNLGHLITYLPLLVAGIHFSGQFLKQRHMFYLFVSNSIITYLITLYIERNRKGPSKMITPKAHGGVTALSFLSAAFALKPDQLLFGSKMIPFFIIPATFAMYEYYEYQNAYVNEICREAHLGSLAWGFLFGLIFRRMRMTGNV